MTEPTYTIVPPFTVLEDGVTCVTVGLFATLYLQKTNRTASREAVVKGLEHYLTLAGKDLKHFANPITQRTEPFSPTTLAYIRDYLIRQSNKADAQQFYICGGESTEEVSSFEVGYLGQADWERDYDELGYFDIKLPYDWYAGRNDSFPQLFHELCEILQPYHGYGGLGIFVPNWNLNRQRKLEEVVYTMAKPYPWFEVDYPLVHVDALEDGIKSICWLNALSNVWVDKLGGEHALRAQLGPEFTVRNYPGGLSIQAGPEPNPDGPSIHQPLAEQMARGLEPRFEYELPEDPEARRSVYVAAMPLHRKLAKILKPIRAQNLPAFHSAWFQPKHYFDQAETQQWLDRFDSE